jgi:hypothetical protein
MSDKGLLESFVFSEDSGTIHFNGVRYMIIRSETICTPQRLVEDRLRGTTTDISLRFLFQ